MELRKWSVLVLGVWLIGCGNPIQPTTVTTYDINPPIRCQLPSCYYGDDNHPIILDAPNGENLNTWQWACRGRFLRDPGAAFWEECRRRGY